jgi:hypothetical protein
VTNRFSYGTAGMPWLLFFNTTATTISVCSAEDLNEHAASASAKISIKVYLRFQFL